MIRRRDQLLKWLIEAAQDDTLLRCTLENCLTRVELLGMFNPLLGSKNPGWLVRVTSSRGREELVGIVKNHLTLPDHFFFASGIDWGAWEGPSDDVMIGGDEGCRPIEKTKVVHCKYDKYDVLIDRTTKYGNPYIMGPDGSRDVVCDRHEAWLQLWTEHKKEVIVRGRSNKWVIEHLNELNGKRIACHCSPARCHGDNYVGRIHEQEKTSDTGPFHRIKQCTAVYTQKSSGAGDTTAGPGLDEKRSNPPVIPISHPPTIT